MPVEVQAPMQPFSSDQTIGTALALMTPSIPFTVAPGRILNVVVLADESVTDPPLPNPTPSTLRSPSANRFRAAEKLSLAPPPLFPRGPTSRSPTSISRSLALESVTLPPSLGTIHSD